MLNPKHIPIVGLPARITLLENGMVPSHQTKHMRRGILVELSDGRRAWYVLAKDGKSWEFCCYHIATEVPQPVVFA